MNIGAVSILHFCQTHGISVATFYNLRKRGEAPIVMKVGKRRLVSLEAAASWRRRMENLADAQPDGGSRHDAA
jgi:predicted DNA-binding transcriptional regulator AlpA